MEQTGDGGADYQKEIDALERILFRLASVTDERMLEVLQSLLPQLLKLFPKEMSTPLAVQLKDKVSFFLYVFRLLSAGVFPVYSLACIACVSFDRDRFCRWFRMSRPGCKRSRLRSCH